MSLQLAQIILTYFTTSPYAVLRTLPSITLLGHKEISFNDCLSQVLVLLMVRGVLADIPATRKFICADDMPSDNVDDLIHTANHLPVIL